MTCTHTNELKTFVNMSTIVDVSGSVSAGVYRILVNIDTSDGDIGIIMIYPVSCCGREELLSPLCSDQIGVSRSETSKVILV